MSCSHAMIILCGVCTEQTVFASSSSAEQSAHCVMCRAAAVIMAIMSSPGQIGFFFFFMVRTKEPDREGGRSRRADLLHSCRVGWICEEWREKKWNTEQIDVCTFISKPYLFPPRSLLSLQLRFSHHVPDNRREVLIKMLMYLSGSPSGTPNWTYLPWVLPLRLHTVCSWLYPKPLPIYYIVHYSYCPPFYLCVRILLVQINPLKNPTVAQKKLHFHGTQTNSC